MSNQNSADSRGVLKNALVQMRQMRQRIAELEQGEAEPIAVIGLGCRLPGQADTPDRYWDNLKNGRNGITAVPASRWDSEKYYSEDRSVPGTSYVHRGGFIEGIREWEPQFFGISPREALGMDPQQRLLMEVAWETMEHAAVLPADLRGSKTAVFIGQSSDDYAQRTTQSADLSRINPYTSLGNHRSVTAGRLSHWLGLHGVTLQLDTACSSSLLAIHLAVQSLRQKESDCAFAGGVNLILTPNMLISMAKLNSLSPEGHCRTFDADANGYVRGEGCGLVLLKRLTDAKRDGDRVLAVIRGSAANHDGTSNGLTAPNGQAQVALLQEALVNAKLNGRDIQYVETHGTGTPLGDPIEVNALGQVLGKERTTENPIRLGAVKTNIGHLEAVAGVAGFIKTVLALHHQQIPQNLHFATPNPHINWHKYPLKVMTELEAWPKGENGRFAGVSSFGISGTNVHVILEGESREERVESREGVGPWVLPVSGRTRGAVEGLARKYEGYLKAEGGRRKAEMGSLDDAYLKAEGGRRKAEMGSLDDVYLKAEGGRRKAEMGSLDDVCLTGGMWRTGFGERVAVVGGDRAELVRRLEGVSVDDVVTVKGGERSVAFMFAGQGGQYVGMGMWLYETEGVFREIVDRCDGLLPWSLVEVLEGGRRKAEGGKEEDSSLVTGHSSLENGGGAQGAKIEDIESRIDLTEFTQPALFAVQVGLARLWRSWGVEPDVVLGHSMGEVAAAVVVGMMSLEDGLKLVAARGRLIQSLPDDAGAMALVLAGRAAVEPFLTADLRVSLAVENGPDRIVLSGDKRDLGEVMSRLDGAGIVCRQLRVSYGSHSMMMAPILEAFRAEAEELSYQVGDRPFVSSMTGELIDRVDADYWADHLAQPVLFAKALEQAAEYDIFMEIGPRPALITIGQETSWGAEKTWLASLHPKAGRELTMQESLARLYMEGVEIDWAAVYPHGRAISMPTYAFDRQTYWLEPREVQVAQAAESWAEIPLPGSRNKRFAFGLGQDSPLFLADHRVFDQVVVPAAQMIDMVLRGHGAGYPVALTDLTLGQALVLADGEMARGQLVLSESGRFQLFSQAKEDGWPEHLSGTINAITEEGPDVVGQLAAYQDGVSRPVDVQQIYANYRARGIDFGPAFQNMVQVWSGEREALAQVRVDAADLDTAVYAPLLDACIQVIGAALPETARDEAFIQIGLDRLALYRPFDEPEVWAHVTLTAVGEAQVGADLQIFASSGELIAVLQGILLQKIGREAFGLGKAPADWFYGIEWEAAEGDHNQAAAGVGEEKHNWLVIGDPANGLTGSLRGRLQEAGAQVVLLADGDDAAVLTEDSGAVWRVAYVADAGLVSVERGLEIVHLVLGETFPQVAQMWVMTQQEEMGIEQAALWGFGRVLAQEHPELNVVLRDVEGREATDRLVAEMIGGVVNRELWVGSGDGRVPRLDRLNVDVGGEGKPVLIPDKNYLVTGGLGGLGLVTAEWLIGQGAKAVWLVGRSVPSEVAQVKIEGWREAGVVVETRQVDVSVFDQVAALLGEMTRSGRPLGGVIHAAGTYRDSLIRNMTREQIRAVFAAKVVGAQHLDRLTREMALDFFVLYSSASAVLGGVGIGNYVAANSYLDALAAERQANGLAGLSINWGPWAQVGMAESVGAQREQQWQTWGIYPLEPTLALDGLGRAIGSAVAQVAIMKIDWAVYHGQSVIRQSLLARLKPVTGEEGETAEAGRLLAELGVLPERERPLYLQRYLQGEVGAILGFATAEDVGLTQGFFDLGLDSLMAMELRNRLQAALDQTFSATLTFKYPNIAELAGFIMDEIGERERGEEKEEEEEKEEVGELERDAWSEEIRAMDEADLLQFIDNELGDLFG